MKTVAQNRRARYDYEILDTVEAGLMLSGQEVKSVRGGQMDLAGSYVSFASGKPVLKSAKIPPYKHATVPDGYNPGIDRQLLLKKTEIERLQSLADQKGVSIIPLEVKAGRFIKLIIGVGKGKKTLDKRRVIRERDVDRRLRRGEY